MLTDNLVEYGKNRRSFLLHHDFCLFDIGNDLFLHELFHYERFEKLHRHLRRQTALPEL